MNDLPRRLRSAVLPTLLAALGLPRLAAAALPPPAVSTAAASPTAVVWNWTLVPGATAYSVISTTGTSLSGLLGPSATTFAQATASTNTTASAYVEAYDASPADTVDSASFTARSAAATPSGSMLLGSVYNRVTLSWLANGNAAGTLYEVRWQVGTSTEVVLSTVSVAGTSVAATLNDLPGGQTVAMHVRAFNSDGVGTPFDVTLATFVAAVAAQPVLSSGTYALGISSIAWYWSASTGAVQYQLFSGTGGAVSPPIAVSSATQPAQLSYTQTGLLPNTAYAEYVQAFDGTTSTTSAPFTRFTLAAPTTSLALVRLDAAAGAELLSWGANGNPYGTVYNVLWWTPLTSTISFSSATNSAVASGLFAGASIYFTVQAQNGEGIRAGFDSTLAGGPVSISTYFPVGQQASPGGSVGDLTFLLPNEVVHVKFSSQTFSSAVTLTVSTPTGSVPAPNAGLAPLSPAPVLQIAALDSFGAPQQPRQPVFIGIAYVPGSLGATDPASLSLARYDASHAAWVALATAKNGSSLWAVTDHLSLFQLFGVSAPRDLSSISVGPNPLRPVENPGQLMTFRNLPAGARVRIFDYVGEKLADLPVDASGVAAWDGRNGRGAAVASGVYLALVEGGGAKKTLRVAIER